ncbi:MAG: hypothetical protein HQL56_10095 [Magnetococcales bacterium]|nr:hypothetical protein [Magnetococcales bacterium]
MSEHIDKNSQQESAPPSGESRTESIMRDSLMHAIAERKKVDPYVGLSIGAQEVNQHLLAALKDGRGVHVETLLAILGSLAGYACQVAGRVDYLSGRNKDHLYAVHTMEDSKGRKYYTGEPIFAPLLSNHYSVYGLVCGQANQYGCTEYPDPHELARHVVESIGTPAFGVPRLPPDHKPAGLPIHFVKSIWPKLLPIMLPFCEGYEQVPFLLGISLQEILKMSKDILPPKLALTIIMECAMPMSKIDIDTDYS